MRLLIVFFAFLFIGCKILSGQNACKKNLKEALLKNWKYVAAKKAYSADANFLYKLDSTYKDCLQGKDTTYISKLFGQHYSIRKTGSNYRMEFPMTPYDDKSVAGFFFVLDEKYKSLHCYLLIIDEGKAIN